MKGSQIQDHIFTKIRLLIPIRSSKKDRDRDYIAVHITIPVSSVQPAPYMPKEISDFTTWLQTSEPSQRVQFLNYLRSLTTVLEENELDTYLNPSPVKLAFNTRAANRKQPTLSYQTQTRLKNQKNTRKNADFMETLDGEGIAIQKLLP